VEGCEGVHEGVVEGILSGAGGVTMETKQECSTCVYFRDMSAGRPVCRRYAKYYKRWDTDWCGEWREKKWDARINKTVTAFGFKCCANCDHDGDQYIVDGVCTFCVGANKWEKKESAPLEIKGCVNCRHNGNQRTGILSCNRCLDGSLWEAKEVLTSDIKNCNNCFWKGNKRLVTGPCRYCHDESVWEAERP
jgi:hypothetical protein